MGIILSCHKSNHKSIRKSEKEYFLEIFDGLDINGDQTLDTDELKSIWNMVKAHKLVSLKKELHDITNSKNKEIERVMRLESDSLLNENSKFEIDDFSKIVKELKMSREELHNLWLNTKKKEVETLNKLLDEYR